MIAARYDTPMDAYAEKMNALGYAAMVPGVSVTIAYRDAAGKESVRTVHGFRLDTGGDSADYLKGHDELSGQPRTFVLDRLDVLCYWRDGKVWTP